MFESSAGEPSQPVSYELYDNLLDTGMKRLALGVIILVATSCTRAVPPPPLPKEPWVTVLDARGQRMGGLAVSQRRYHQGLGPRISGSLAVDARDPKGRTINAWGLYGYVDGSKVQVVLLNEIVMPTEPGHAAGARPTLRWEESARYALVTGETRVIPEWKALGLTGMSVRLEGR
jgi:hypothetical protein